MKIITKIFQIVIILIPVVLFFWLANQFLIPSGEFKVAHSVNESSSFIDHLLTDERVSDPYKDAGGNWIQRIFADPVFFFVHPHRGFEHAEFEVWFKNDDVPIVELGSLATKGPERYSLKPLQNLIIDNSTWSKLTSGNTVLLQRNNVYSSLEDFYQNPPSRSELVTYHASFENKFRIPSYQPSGNISEINTSLRGHHEIKTYIKNEPLNFKFFYSDMNRDEGQDPVSVVVFNEDGEPVADALAVDDGNITKNAFSSNLQTVELSVPGLPEGVYKIVVNAGRDIFFRTIKTSQQKIIFLNMMFIGDEVGYMEPPRPATIWTEAKRISFQTRHAEGLQTIRVASQSLVIDEPYKYYTKSITRPGLSSIYSPLGDIEIISDSPMSFSRSQFFRPDPVRLLPHTNLDALKINYLLAEYTPPKTIDSWKVATVSFAASEMLLDDGSWKMSFSTPEIKEMNKEMFVKEINMKWIRAKTSWKDLLKVFKK
jgi:hypothetical protein